MSQNPDDYTYVLATVGFSGFVKEALRLELVEAADDQPNRASLIRQAIARLESRLEKVALDTAKSAEALVKGEEIATRVRPDTGGGGGPRLNDFVGVSSPLLAVPGSVGINHEPTLDNNGVRWWPTNEYGSSARVGGTFIGAFDGTKPSKNMRRQHALLVMGRTPGAGKGTIEEPIPARHFVRDGGRAAEVQWHAQVRAAKAAFMAEVRLALGT